MADIDNLRLELDDLRKRLRKEKDPDARIVFKARMDAIRKFLNGQKEVKMKGGI